jgi:hypothetical protein
MIKRRPVYRVGSEAAAAADALRARYEFLDAQVGRETQSGAERQDPIKHAASIRERKSATN